MVILKQQQYQHESNTWERLLDLFKQENSFLMNRLSEVLDSKEDKSFLPIAEHFQNQFILKDQYINELKRDIREQQRLLKNNLVMNDNINPAVVKRHEKLRNEMRYFEKDFSELKTEFNHSVEN